jgi:hypothetical protein
VSINLHKQLAGVVHRAGKKNHTCTCDRQAVKVAWLKPSMTMEMPVIHTLIVGRIVEMAAAGQIRAKTTQH